jgi:hypothetical protein
MPKLADVGFCSLLVKAIHVQLPHKAAVIIVLEIHRQHRRSELCNLRHHDGTAIIRPFDTITMQIRMVQDLPCLFQKRWNALHATFTAVRHTHGCEVAQNMRGRLRGDATRREASS